MEPASESDSRQRCFAGSAVWLGRLAQTIILIAYFAALVLLTIALDGMQVAGGPFVALVVVLPVFAVAIAVHEFGHFWMAMRRGLVPVRVLVMRLEFKRWRHGWCWRWRRQRAVLAGAVVAYPMSDDLASMRSAYLAMLAGGPLANATLAVVSGCLAGMSAGNAATGAFWAVAVVNAAMALSNALPGNVQGYAMDGLLWRDWRAARDPDAPQVAYLRIVSRSLRGIPAIEWPASDLDRCVGLPGNGAIVADWLRMAVAYERADWAEVERLCDSLARSIAAMPPVMQASMGELAALVRCEGAFARVARGDAIDTDLLVADDALEWLQPGLCDRARAVRAALVGDVGACREALDAMCVHAVEHIERSSERRALVSRHAIERLLAARISAEMPQGADTQLASLPVCGD